MQPGLANTLIMVSHDIDEAIKLVNKMALFRLVQFEQFLHPDQLLAVMPPTTRQLSGHV